MARAVGTDGHEDEGGAWWARALSVAERPPLPRDAGAAVDEVRLKAWRDAYPGLVDDTLALAAEGLGVSAEDVGRLLAEEPEALARRVRKPGWAHTAEAVVAGLPEVWPVAGPAAEGADPVAGPAAEGAEARWQDELAAVVRPFADHAVAGAERSLREGLLREGPSPDAGSAAPSGGRRARPAAGALLDPGPVLGALRAHVTSHLVTVAVRALVLELHRMRAAGRLAGDDPRGRFRSFAEQMCTRPALTRFLAEYPVLTRILATVSGQAADAFGEFVRRLAADRDLLVCGLFGGEDQGPLTEVEFAAGDLHDGGRGVLLLRFASGRRLVYKPRPMAVHAHVNDVLAWFGERLPAAAPRLLGVLDRGEYGWVEHVAPAPCADEAGARRFFFRLGAQLAVLYALSGADFHYENVIAAGDQPVLLDMESVLHVGLPMLTGSPFADEDPAAVLLQHSVGRVGLLPAVLSGRGPGAVDVGGLGGDAGVLLPFPAVDWADPGTDRMHLVRARRTAQGSRNKVVLHGRPAEPERYTDRIRDGFRAGYRALLRHRAELTAPDGPLARFSGDGLRVITRATRIYGRLLDETTHPDVLRDAAERDRVLSLLWALAAGDAPRLALAVHELRDIWAANVPLFRTRASSRDVTAAGGAVLPGLLAASGLERARAIVAGMDGEDLARQDWVIRASMATRAGTHTAVRPLDTGPGRPAGPGATPADLALDRACAVAAALERSAVHADGRIGWFGLDLVAGDQWQVAPLGGDLFNGYAGVGLFFAQLARVLGNGHDAELATRVLAPLAAHAQTVLDRGGQRVRLGAFGGECGLAYALASASGLLAEPGLAAPVPGLLRLAADAVGTDTAYDVMNGAAGCLAVAEALVPRFGAPAAELADRSAAFLVRTALPAGAGVAWGSDFACSQPMLGFSHGAAGIAWALLRHAHRTGDGAARATAYAAFAYERGAYRPDLGNWPDFRSGDSRPWGLRPGPDGVSHMHAWCHGAPGIGLARAALPAAARTPETDADLRLAVASTTRFGLYGNHSLCHGDLGNLELLTAAARLAVPGAAAERERRVHALLDQLDRHGPLCGTPGALASPGLMTGLAGIGHGLLRLARPEDVAPVLLLEAFDA
ncbi:type 2 lanthipeptide synthetase LanM [Streptomyces sp. NPDC021224]|uniref:type 2 lanthipeptide synthetase LanM n=1 Tax=unclassified Streptomyces TaxID=2593676 RepID=UPI00378B5B87